MIDPHHISNVIYNARSNRDPTSPNTAPATKSNTHHWSSSHMKRYLQCAERQESASNFSKYSACHEKWISWLILLTNETLFTMRGATCVIVQTHQILRLPRKMNLMIDPRHNWNVIYNARSNMCHCPNSPNTAPATKNDSHDWFTMRRATCVIVQTHQILRLPRKMTVKNLTEICWKRMKRHFQCAVDPTMIREWSDHDPRMKPSVRNPPRNRGYFSRPPQAFCIEKYNISRSGYHSKFHRILRLPRKVTLQLHQILRLPRRATLIIDPLHTWNVIYNARSNNSPPPTSSSTAPATKNESHDWSFSQMKRYLQCAEQHVSLSKRTKYCACHEKWISWLILVTNETLFTTRGATCVIVQTHQVLRLPQKMTSTTDPCHTWNVIYNAQSNMCHSPNSPNTAPATKNDRPKSHRNLLKTDETSFPMRGRSENDPTMIREWSDHDPRMKPSVRNPPRNRGYFSRPPRAFCIEKYNISRSQISPNTAPATKSDTATSPNAAPATKSDSAIAPATKSDTSTSPIFFYTHTFLRLPV